VLCWLAAQAGLERTPAATIFIMNQQQSLLCERARYYTALLVGVVSRWPGT
jgi:hypothetical protein